MNKPEFDQFAKKYDHVLQAAIPEGLNEDGYFAEYKVQMMVNLLSGKKNLRILDFGCGAGRSLPYLKRHFPDAEIWGYDVSPSSLVVAAARAPGVHLISEWCDLKSIQFDAILAANVFHHIPASEHLRSLSECRSALAPQGKLFLFEHNPYNPLTRWIFERCPFDVDAKMIKLKHALILAKEADFRSVSHGYTFFFPRPFALLRLLEPYLHWLPIGAQYYVQLAK
jgi:SAM-dependent methyltransferase